MLRTVVALLLLANLAFFGWSQGWLDEFVGVRAGGDREPERLAHQVRPDSIVVLPPPRNGTTAVAAADASCLEAGPYTAAEAATAEAALQSTLAPGSWTDIRVERPGAWLVYMGSYPDHETLLRKLDEIRRPGAEIEEVAVPGEGEFGLSLGRYADRGDAERGLALWNQRGIRTARVVQIGAPSVLHLLRIDKADSAVAARLAALKPEALGRGFVACARSDAAR